MKGKFPKTQYPPELLYNDGDYIVGVAHTDDMVIFYFWDGVSESWNKSQAFALINT